MDAPILKYEINGIDFGDLGVTVESGLPDIINIPKRKQPYIYNWPDANGTSGDLSEVFTDSKVINLTCLIEGNSGYNLRANFENFISRFTGANLQRLECYFLGTEHYVYYNSVEDIQQLTKGRLNAGVALRFTLSLTEPNPGVIPTPYTTPAAFADSSGFVYTDASGNVYTFK